MKVRHLKVNLKLNHHSVYPCCQLINFINLKHAYCYVFLINAISYILVGKPQKY